MSVFDGGSPSFPPRSSPRVRYRLALEPEPVRVYLRGWRAWVARLAGLPDWRDVAPIGAEPRLCYADVDYVAGCRALIAVEDARRAARAAKDRPGAARPYEGAL